MSERVTADDVRHVETKIIMTEDKMFREKNYYKKLEIREEIIFLRKKLQKMQFLFKEGYNQALFSFMKGVVYEKTKQILRKSKTWSTNYIYGTKCCWCDCYGYFIGKSSK